MTFAYSDDNKRYHTLSFHNRRTYGEKVFKAVLDCGFTCPNIDGSKGVGGCTYCDGGSGYFTSAGTVTRQLEQEKVLIPTAYARMSVNYENEQRTLINKAAEDEKKLACIEQTSLDLKTLLKAAEDEIKSLTAKIKANPQEYRLTT